MATVAQTRTKNKPADLCRMVVTIRGTDYAVKPLVVEDDDIRAAWTLKKATNGQVYTLANGAYGVTCTCADFEFRHAGNGTACKHVRAFKALGLVN